MAEKKTSLPRLNIYIKDPTIHRQVKTAGAKKDSPVSEYCLRAITVQLIKDGERPHKEGANSLKAAIEKAQFDLLFIDSQKSTPSFCTIL